MSKYIKNLPRKVEWTVQQLDEVKSQAKAQVVQWRETLKPNETLRNILNEIQTRKDSTESENQLWCFVFCMSALVHQEMFGGLNPKQLEELFDLGLSILKVRGIQPRKSRLASMYSDLHLVRSQIYRRQGDHWSAAWEQHLAIRHGGGKLSTGKSFHHFAMGNRLMRIGFKKIALSYYASALAPTSDTALAPSQVLRIQLSRITHLRISGETELAHSLAVDNLRQLEKTDPIWMDLDWERMCCELQNTHDLRPILSATRRGGSHHFAGYVVEQVLWGLCTPTRDWLKQVSSLDSLKRNKSLNIKSLGIFYPMATAIQECYDSTIPIETRLRSLSSWLRQTPELISLDKELMIWLAASRVLVRIRSYELAVLCLGKYESMSRQMSDGTCRDGLCIAADLLDADWYQHPESISLEGDSSSESETIEAKDENKDKEEDETTDKDETAA